MICSLLKISKNDMNSAASRILDFSHPISVEKSIALKFGFIDTFREKFDEWVGVQNWRLVYKASIDDFRAKTFHSKSDDTGSTLSIIQANDVLFGGFTHLNWKVCGCWRKDKSNSSFIFTLTNRHSLPPTKYPLMSSDFAIFCDSHYGPCFGLKDIVVQNKSNHSAKNTSKFPNSYSDSTGKGNLTFTGTQKFKIQEIEVYAFQS